MANYNSKVFDSMLNATKSKAGPLFKEGTESQYNTQSSKEEQGAFDRKAYGYVSKMYTDDQKAGLFQDLDMEQYMNALSGTYFHERVNLPRKDDPSYFEEAGDLFFNVYEGDFDQFMDSARTGHGYEKIRDKAGKFKDIKGPRGKSEY